MNAIFNAVFTFWNQIVYAVSNIRVFDVIDILVIAYLIYKAIQFLRETRAGQLAKGIFVLVAMYLIAKWFDLAVLRWVLAVVFNSAIVALAVIFQPELRRMLEKIGQMNLGAGQVLDSEEERTKAAVDSICKAAGNMKDSKTGALIVFERKTQLGEIINTGTLIDAKPSVSMVCNIFYPKSPLHDGAVVVRDGRLYAAGCILPLTQNNNLSTHLGTRHRAAIGMTENSDAVVLVVSEETGNISIAYNGKISRNYTAATAYAELHDKLIISDEKEKESRAAAVVKRLFPWALKQKKTKEEGEESES
ncbi:MAG: diadenylate cyclase CdaA [Clostridia bacterium]|nr:diadenylate cyclase CdaA [Clostridia bacterium]